MTEFDERHAGDAYPEGIEHGFWSVARHRILDRALRDAARAGLRGSGGTILEIGCGPGIVVAAMREAGHAIWGVELGIPGVRRAAKPYVTVGTKAQDLDDAFRSGVETLMLLDVIEHIEDDVAFLASLLSACPKCRCVIVTVPARPEVWSNYDEHFGHFRRYTRDSLRTALVGARLEPKLSRYFFRALYAAALILKALGRRREVNLSAPSLPRVQAIVAAAIGLEDRIVGALPLPGLSLLAVAAVEGRG